MRPLTSLRAHAGITFGAEVHALAEAMIWPVFAAFLAGAVDFFCDFRVVAFILGRVVQGTA